MCLCEYSVIQLVLAGLGSCVLENMSIPSIVWHSKVSFAAMLNAWQNEPNPKESLGPQALSLLRSLLQLILLRTNQSMSRNLHQAFHCIQLSQRHLPRASPSRSANGLRVMLNCYASAPHKMAASSHRLIFTNCECA